MSTAISALDLFKVGIGPSSSHTVGPMVAARRFALGLAADGRLNDIRRVRTEVYGSLAATGRGHGSDRGVALGLLGEAPDTVDVDAIPGLLARVREREELAILGRHSVRFTEDDVAFVRTTLPFHPNGMRFSAVFADGRAAAVRTFYSIGGGFVVEEHEACAGRGTEDVARPVPFPFGSAKELLARCFESGLPISGVMLANERVWRDEAETRSALLRIWEVMRDCVGRGCEVDGMLPGGLAVRRRAPTLARALAASSTDGALAVVDRLTLWALAVNEENAAGGRVVTAPTNGAAGIVPAVLHHFRYDVPCADDEGVIRFLLAAAAIGTIYKNNASISGAEVGCQGEVGVACSMAAGALAEVMGGTPEQAENAAEIAMEHHLGLTCDPVGGLVQIPCIERNAVAAVSAVTAARMALLGDGRHRISLDAVVKTMRETGADMKSKYKETARGGLALNACEQSQIGVNIPEC